VQRKARCRQATIGWLHPRKPEVDQSDFGVVSLAFIQQVLQVHNGLFAANKLYNGVLASEG